MAKNAVFLLMSCVCLSMPIDAYAAWDWSDFGYTRFLNWVVYEQVDLHRQLVMAVQKLSRHDSPALLWSLVSGSFIYGIFHAAGPGHGKAVISSYMLASRAPLRRAISLSFLCAAVQGLMAVALIVVLGQIFSLVGKAMRISQFFEIASFAAVGFIGVWMLVRLLRGKSSCGHDHSHDHKHIEAHHTHTHDHGGEHKDCDHSVCQHHQGEVKSAEQVVLDDQKADRRSIWAMVGAVGIRPCTGAVLVLVFSMSAGIFHWGLVATAAMSLGTAITVAGLAIISVMIRDSSFAITGTQGVWQRRLSVGFGYFAAIALIIISISMIWTYASYAGRPF